MSSLWRVRGTTAYATVFYVVGSVLNTSIYPTHIEPAGMPRDLADRVVERARRVAPAGTTYEVVEVRG